MKKSDAIRLKRVIESDRMSMTCESASLIIKDLESVLSDYFSVESTPSLAIKSENGGYLVQIKFRATSLKTFASIPDR